MRKFINLLSCAALFSCSSYNASFAQTEDSETVFDFDKIRTQTDGNAFIAMKKILGQINALDGKSAKVVFNKKEYDLPYCESDFVFINGTNLKNTSIEGNGATLKIHPANAFLKLSNCENVKVKNFTVIYSPSPFTQGTISNVNPADGTFELSIEDGYPTLPEHQKVIDRYGKNGWEWGSVMDAKDRQRKRNVIDHYFIARADPIDGKNKFKITVEKNYADHLKGVCNGDRFAMPVHNLKDNAQNAFTPNATISGSANILLENITLHRNRNSMCFAIGSNKGKVTMRGNKITWLPDSNDVISSWRDGYHCKSNIIGPTIEKCRTEGLLDDSINISTNTIMITKVIDDKTFELTHWGFQSGDQIGFLFIDTAKWIDDVKVVSVKDKTITIDKPITGIKEGQMRPYIDIKSTQVYNMKRVNSGFKIKNCFFGKQRRNPMLIRAFDGKIEDNTINNPASNGIHLSNEIGMFYEGPFPKNIKISGNTFKNTWSDAVCVGSQTSAGKPIDTNYNIKIYNNVFINAPDKPTAISIYNSSDVKVKGNTFKNSNSTPNDPLDAIKVSNAENVEIKQ